MTTTVSGEVGAFRDEVFDGLVATLTRQGGVVGFDGGAIAPDVETYVTSGGGVLTMPDLKPGKYTLTLAVPANPETTQTVLWQATGTVPSDAGATITLEAFLDKNVGEVTPSLLQQAIAAKDAAEAAAIAAAASAASVDSPAIASYFDFATRAALITFWDGLTAQEKLDIDGAVLSDGDVVYVVVDGSTGIPDILGLEPLGKPQPHHFGIVQGGTVSQNTRIAAFISYVDSKFAEPSNLLGPTPEVDFQGFYMAIDNTVDFTVQRLVRIHGGTFFALPSANWDIDTWMGRFPSNYGVYKDLYFDCAYEAYNGARVGGGRSGVRVHVERMKGEGVGIYIPPDAGPEVYLERCISGQHDLNFSETEFLDNAAYTATAYKIDKTDTKMIDCQGRWSKRLVDVTDLTGVLTVKGGHFYNGGAAQVQRTNPEGFVGMGEPSAEITFLGTYLDNCTNIFYGDRVNGHGVIIVLDGDDVDLTSGFKFFDFRANGQTHPRCNIQGFVNQWDLRVGGSADLFAFEDEGANSWTLDYTNMIADMTARLTGAAQRFAFHLSPAETKYTTVAAVNGEARLVSAGALTRQRFLDNGTTDDGPYTGSEGDDLIFGADGQQARIQPDGTTTLPGALNVLSGALNVLKLSLEAPTNLTISSGAITVTQNWHKVTTGGGAADLTTINGGETGDILLLHNGTPANVVTIKNNTGNIRCGADRVLNSFADAMVLIKNTDGNWNQVAFSDNA